MNIRQVFGHYPCTGDVAVEVESEGWNLPRLNTHMWTTKRDRSLKGKEDCYEYVMKGPVDKTVLFDTLKDFNKNFELSRVDDSIYAGIHIHVNVQELSPTELVNYLCAVLVLEDLLVDWCGNTRVGNHFCLRSTDAEAVLEFMKDLVEDGDLKVVDTDAIRYCFFNLKSVASYGSLEFRSLNSTIDPVRINTWAQVLLNVKEQSIKFSNPVELVNYIKNNVNEWLMNVFTLVYYKDFVKGYWEDKVLEGIYKAEELAYSREWSSLNFNIFKTKNSHF